MSESQLTERAEDAGGAGYRYRWLVLVLVLVADVMDMVDATVANLAGPSIRADVGGGESTLQWVLAGYTLAFAVGLVTSARAGDVVGRRTMFLTGMIGFTVFSGCAALAPTAWSLVAARVLQGAFGAVMIPQGFAFLKQVFPPHELRKAFIPFGPAMALSAVLGPILAGVLIDLDLWGLGWRLVFAINLPIGLVATVLAVRYLPDTPRDPEARLDPVGSALLTVSSALLIYPLVQGRELGWPWWTFVMLLAAGAGLALFAVGERRSEHPVIEPSLFRHRAFVAGLGFMVAFFVAMNGFMLVANLFVQLGLGRGPLQAGLAMTPMAVGIALGATVTGALLAERLGRRLIHAGALGAAVGLVVLWWTLGQQGPDVSVWHLAPGLFLTGLGSGAIFVPLFDYVVAGLDERQVGTGSGVLNACQQFSGALGVAVLGTVFFHWLPELGWVEATRHLLWIAAAGYLVAFAAVFALPTKPRQAESA